MKVREDIATAFVFSNLIFFSLTGLSLNSSSMHLDQIELNNRHFPLVNYAPYWIPIEGARKNYSEIVDDLNLVSYLGFKGVKLWNIEGFHDNGIVDKIFSDLQERGLVAVLPFRVWRQEQFPENQSAIDEFKAFVANVSIKLKTKTNLLWYTVHYPVDWNNITGTMERFKTEAYRSKLQEIINTIWNNDPVHPIYMSLEFDPNWGAPYNLMNIQGFGVEPWTYEEAGKVQWDKVRAYIDYFRLRGENVYIDEWGVQTVGGYPSWVAEHGEVRHGKAMSEQNKAQMVKDFVEGVRSLDIVWSYFALHDTNESDWGLANNNNMPKESGKAMKEMLQQFFFFEDPDFQIESNSLSRKWNSTIWNPGSGSGSYAEISSELARFRYDETTGRDWGAAILFQGKYFHNIGNWSRILGGTNETSAKRAEGISFDKDFKPKNYLISTRLKITERRFNREVISERHSTPKANIGVELMASFACVGSDGRLHESNYFNPGNVTSSVRIAILLASFSWDGSKFVHKPIQHNRDYFVPAGSSFYDADYHIGFIRGYMPNLDEWYEFNIDLGEMISLAFHVLNNEGPGNIEMIIVRGVQVYAEAIGVSVSTIIDYVHPLLDFIPPTANAGYSRTTLKENSVNFNASNSSDNVGIASYEWDLGDGGKGTGETLSHIYKATGVYVVTLTVKDFAGNVDVDRITVSVLPYIESCFLWMLGVAVISLVLVFAVVYLWKRKS